VDVDQGLRNNPSISVPFGIIYLVSHGRVPSIVPGIANHRYRVALANIFVIASYTTPKMEVYLMINK
jgi:hypothetical protein